MSLFTVASVPGLSRSRLQNTYMEKEHCDRLDTMCSKTDHWLDVNYPWEPIPACWVSTPPSEKEEKKEKGVKLGL